MPNLDITDRATSRQPTAMSHVFSRRFPRLSSRLTWSRRNYLRSPRIVAARLGRLKSKARPAERHLGVLWKPQRFVQLRIVKHVPEIINDLAISTKLIRKHKLDRSQHECEKCVVAVQQRGFYRRRRTRSRRATAAASGSLCVGGRFCHSKFCAALALSITRSDFMEKKRVKLWCAGSCE